MLYNTVMQFQCMPTAWLDRTRVFYIITRRLYAYNYYMHVMYIHPSFHMQHAIIIIYSNEKSYKYLRG